MPLVNSPSKLSLLSNSSLLQAKAKYHSYSFTLLPFYPFTLLPFYPFYSFSIEHMTLLLLAPRVLTDWASRPFDTNELQINIFYAVNVCKLLKKINNSNKKWNVVSMILEHTTLTLSGPRSTDWASRLFDTNVLQITNFYAVNVCKLLKKRS